LAKSETHEITKEVLKEFTTETFGGKSSKTYHEDIVGYFKSTSYYLADVKGNLGIKF
jgi:hypothetical protein